MARQSLLCDFRPIYDHAGVQGQQSLRRGQHRVDVNLFDPALLDYELAEAHQQFFDCRNIDRFAPAHTEQRVENLRLFHHPSRQGGVERRQSQGMVLEDFHQLPAGAKQDHRPELRVDAAAHN